MTTVGKMCLIKEVRETAERRGVTNWKQGVIAFLGIWEDSNECIVTEESPVFNYMVQGGHIVIY